MRIILQQYQKAYSKANHSDVKTAASLWFSTGVCGVILKSKKGQDALYEILGCTKI